MGSGLHLQGANESVERRCTLTQVVVASLSEGGCKLGLFKSQIFLILKGTVPKTKNAFLLTHNPPEFSVVSEISQAVDQVSPHVYHERAN